MTALRDIADASRPDDVEALTLDEYDKAKAHYKKVMHSKRSPPEACIPTLE